LAAISILRTQSEPVASKKEKPLGLKNSGNKPI
jgi:hypothetical protein